jgi:microcystin degradation protein MlrC
LPLVTRVAGLFDARFVLSGHLARNLPIDMGPSAVLRHDNVHIIVTSRSGAHFAPELFRVAGLDPFAAAVLVAKSPCGFRAAYQERARKILVVQAPGCAPSDYWNYAYQRIDRPLWPWDEMENWEPAPGIAARK